jgi:hypothetical protein
LVAAIALTVGAGIKYWNATVKLARPQRQQPQERVRDDNWTVVNIPIDWSGVAANLMRSDVPSQAQKGVSEAFFLTGAFSRLGRLWQGLSTVWLG